jgi:hypothetical protein
MNSKENNIDKFLYFEPVIYIAPEVTNGKEYSVKILETGVEDKGNIDLDKHFKGFVPLDNPNFLMAKFHEHPHLIVNELIGTKSVAVLIIKYEITIECQEPIKIFHRNILNFKEAMHSHNIMPHYSSSFSLPAMYGEEGVVLAKGLENKDNHIYRMGLSFHDKTNKTWVIETLSCIYPSTETKINEGRVNLPEHKCEKLH